MKKMIKKHILSIGIILSLILLTIAAAYYSGGSILQKIAFVIGLCLILGLDYFTKKEDFL